MKIILNGEFANRCPQGYMIRMTAVFILVSTLVECSSQQVPSSRFTYEERSERLYDRTEIISPGQFSQQSLLNTFQKFSTNECAKMSIVRWIIAPSETELMYAINTYNSELTSASIKTIITSDPLYVKPAPKSLRVAELLCFGGQASVRIRDGERTISRLLAGSHESQKWSIGGQNFEIIGLQTPHPAVRSDKAILFLRSNTLPTPAVVERVLDYFESQSKIELNLILRTDDQFFNYGGPGLDPFSTLPRAYSPEQFLTSPHILCKWNGAPRCSMQLVPQAW